MSTHERPPGSAACRSFGPDAVALPPVLARPRPRPRPPPPEAGRDWAPLVGRLVADGLDRTEVEALFKRAEISYDPEPMRLKMRSLYDGMFGRKSILTIQKNLKSLGYKVGPLDGRYGPKTRRAVLAFQKKMFLTTDALPGNGLRRGSGKGAAGPEKDTRPGPQNR